MSGPSDPSDLPDTLTPDLATSAWRLDPARSSVEFHVPHFYGLMTVKGRFRDFEGTLDLRQEPAVQLTIEAASIDTGNAKRDKHLRSKDFFGVEQNPQLRFVSDSATLAGERLKVTGKLHANGASVPLELDATLHTVDGEPEIEAVTEVDQRLLGMTWSPAGITRTPTKLIVRGPLTR
jgi:polyisoprenoid-binding protein YceI